MKRLLSVTALLLCLLAGGGAGAQSPQFRGPTRDGVFPDTGLLQSWPEGGPKLLWSVDGLGSGWSSVAVAGGAAYVTGMDADGQGQLFCYDLGGSLKWRATYGPEDAKAGGHPGTRSTPTVDGDRLYVLSSTGVLNCLAAADGKPLFQVNLVERFKGVPPQWAYAESILIDGDRAICTPGGPDASLVALNKLTGETVWTSTGLGEKSAFCSPNLYQVGDRRLLVTQLKGALVGVDADTGKRLWHYPFANQFGVQPDTPLYSQGRLCANGGRGPGAAMLELSADGGSVSEKWVNKGLDGQHHGLLWVGGGIYGTSGAGKQMYCLDPATGQTRWTAPGLGHLSTAYADGMIYAYSEKGDLLLIKASPEAFTQVGRFAVPKGSGEHWAHPTIADGRLYLRHGDSLMVYDLKNQ